MLILIMNSRIPFTMNVNATNIGTLKAFKNKWDAFSDHRKITWINNFKPSYDTYLQRQQYLYSLPYIGWH